MNSKDILLISKHYQYIRHNKKRRFTKIITYILYTLKDAEKPSTASALPPAVLYLEQRPPSDTTRKRETRESQPNKKKIFFFCPSGVKLITSPTKDATLIFFHAIKNQLFPDLWCIENEIAWRLFLSFCQTISILSQQYNKQNPHIFITKQKIKKSEAPEKACAATS